MTDVEVKKITDSIAGLDKIPVSATEANEQARRFTNLKKIIERAEQLFLPEDGKYHNGTRGYAAVVLIKDDKPTRRFYVGKPYKQGSGDHTKKGGGPYVVDLDENTCTCPSFVGIPEHVNDKGITIKAVTGEGECKHHIGILWALANFQYELKSISNVEDRKIVKWILP